MKTVCLAYFYYVNNPKQSGYTLEGTNTGKVYFEGKTKDDCRKYASDHNLKILYEC